LRPLVITVVVGVDASLAAGADVVVVTAPAVVVVEGGALTWVVVVRSDVVEDVVTSAGATACTGGEPVEALSVNTSTRRRIGLDHITHCVLLSECRSLMEVLEGRLPGQGEIVVHS
jgi:hypothetical protein